MNWQILIPTIPHRHAKLVNLLDVLEPQMMPGVEVIIFHDNLETSYAAKLQALYDRADADYVSSLADDDSVSPDFVLRICQALYGRPDYVGFRVRYTEQGIRQAPVIHSLQCGGWYADANGLLRDLMYYNPLRRELAQQVKFRGPYCDEEWADDLRRLDIVKTEVFVDAELLYYQRDSTDNFHTPRTPLPADAIPALPQRPFVRYL